MRIDVFTIFPDMVDDFAGASLARARPASRARSTSGSTTSAPAPPTTHRSVDDAPFGGGAGMVLMPEPLFAAVEAVDPPRPLLLLGPGGPPLRPGAGRGAGGRRRGSRCCAGATRGSTSGSATDLVDGELSIGDFVLAGGEVAAMVVIEAVGRLVPGVMGNEASATEESFSDGPARVPAVHPARRRSGAGRCPRSCAPATTAQVARWRRAQALGPDPGAPSRPDRGPGRPQPTTSVPARRVRPHVGRSGPAAILTRPPVPVPRPATRRGATCAMQPTDLVDQRQPARRHPRLRPRRHR